MKTKKRRRCLEGWAIPKARRKPYDRMYPLKNKTMDDLEKELDRKFGRG